MSEKYHTQTSIVIASLSSISLSCPLKLLRGLLGHPLLRGLAVKVFPKNALVLLMRGLCSSNFPPVCVGLFTIIWGTAEPFIEDILVSSTSCTSLTLDRREFKEFKHLFVGWCGIRVIHSPNVGVVGLLEQQEADSSCMLDGDGDVNWLGGQGEVEGVMASSECSRSSSLSFLWKYSESLPRWKPARYK